MMRDVLRQICCLAALATGLAMAATDGAAQQPVSPLPYSSGEAEILQVQVPAVTHPEMQGRTPPSVDIDTAEDVTYGVLVLNVEQAYADSAWGQRARAEIDAEVIRLDAENKRLENQLKAEEAALTAERETLSPEKFRKQAEAFDTRAQTVRRERAEVVVDLENRAQADLETFLDATQPVIKALMQEYNAGVVLDRRQTLVIISAVDITDELVARMDATVGEGDGLPAAVLDEGQPAE
ncbi:MAG: OmpH family outer membrane protein [Paracoccus sp. (in: a-proteobacteria)]